VLTDARILISNIKEQEMKRYCLFISLLTSFMLLLSLSAYAATGDVTVRLNGGGPNNFANPALGNNTLEFMLTNSGPVAGMSLGFEFTSAGPFDAVPGWGTFPSLPPVPCPATPYLNIVKEHGDAVGKFDLGFLQVNPCLLPDSILIGGAALASPLPAHAVSTLCYSMQFNFPAQPDALGGFCVDNIFYPPAGSWSFNIGGGFPPTFNGAANASTANPSAPPVCFDIVTPPCPPPTFTATPNAVENKNHCLQFSFDFDASFSPPATGVTFSSSVGTINAGSGLFTLNGVATCGSTPVTVTATADCGAATDFNFTVNWTNNNPSVSNCAGASGAVGMGNQFSRDFNSTDADPCDAAVWSVAQTGGPAAVGPFGISGTGLFTFNTDSPGDGGNTYEFTATVTDPCGGTGNCVFTVEVLEVQPFIIKIDKTHNSLQGHFEYVCIRKIAGSEEMGGFDFLVGYDNSALSFFSATLGADLGPAGCGWEYFTYRYGAFGNCGGPCPSGKLRVVAIADQNNGANHPSCYQVPDGGCLVELKFYVTNDRTFECQYVPIRFVWFDCGDNGISSRTGDTLFISSQVFEFQNTDPLSDPNFEITGLDCGIPFHYGGACPDCDVSQKYQPIRFIIFWNGGIDIVCADSIDARGDLNLNGIENEIADAVLYTNFFLYGMGALDPIFFDAQIAASDVNADGVPLSVADLVYLLRIIVGDALPFPKLSPFANSVTINVAEGMVSSESATDLGAIYATYTVKGAYTLVNHSNMELVSAESNGELKVLVYSGMTNMTNRIDAGSSNLFSVNGDVELKNVEVSDYSGNLLASSINKSTLPTSYALLQNVPNPFNPTTKIGLNLPVASDWSIDIFNVAGQLVESFRGHGVGNITVDWNAKAASGIYFYKATAGSFTDTKKMVLMK
jgi:hypothetical protein